MTKTEKTSLLFFRSFVAHVVVLCACECKRAYLLSPPNHQPPFGLRTTTRTINLKNIFSTLGNGYVFYRFFNHLGKDVIPSYKRGCLNCLVRKIVFERSDGLSSFGCVRGVKPLTHPKEVFSVFFNHLPSQPLIFNSLIARSAIPLSNFNF